MPDASFCRTVIEILQQLMPSPTELPLVWVGWCLSKNSWIRLGWVCRILGWVVLGQEIWTRVHLRAIFSIAPTSWWPPSGERAGLQLLTLVRQTKTNKKTKKTYIDNSFSCFENLEHHNKYLTRHSDVKFVCHQPVCHYAAPLLGGIETNAT